VGGVADYTLRLRAALDGYGWPSSVLTTRRGSSTTSIHRCVRRWNMHSLLWLLRIAPRTGIVHIQYQPAAFDLLGAVCLMPLVLRLTHGGIRVVTTFHDTRVPYLFPKAGRLRLGSVRLLARSSHAVLAAEEQDLRALAGPPSRKHQVPIGPNVGCYPVPRHEREALRARLGVPAGGLCIVYFGLLNASKGLDTLLGAFEEVLRREPKALLLLLGGEVGASDLTDRTTAAIIRPQLERFGDRVVRTGYLRPAELSAHLLAGDVAALPYRDGASARRGSLLACAEHSLPIVSTLPATPTVANAVRAVPPGDPVALAHATLELAGDPHTQAELRRAARRLAERCSWPRIVERHVSIYAGLLK
jgi:glycosyltransferase involved in cell wall biosynthesis